MYRNIFNVMCITAIILFTLSPSQAITYGEPDTENMFSNVGTMIILLPDGDIFPICSGTLIDNDVVLTASHCIQPLINSGITDLWVTFDPVISSESPLIPATYFINPDYSQWQNDPGDIGVLMLDYPASDIYSGITPAELPTLELLDELAIQNGLHGATFICVGYGLQEPAFGGGPPTFGPSGERRFSYSEFRALNKAFIRLSQNPATDDGGTCYGDSGGPIFLDVDGSLVLVALTVTGDTMCRATNVDYRTDIESARSFLEDFVALP